MVVNSDNEVRDDRTGLQETGTASFIVNSHNSTAIGDEIRTLPERYPGTQFRVIIEAIYNGHTEAFDSSVTPCDNQRPDCQAQWEPKMSPNVSPVASPSALATLCDCVVATSRSNKAC